MSTDKPKPGPSSTDSAPNSKQPGSQTPARTDSNRESGAVRLTLLLLILVAVATVAFVERRFYNGYRDTLSAWQEAVQLGEQGVAPGPLTLTKAHRMVEGNPTSSPLLKEGHERFIVYRWPSLLFRDYSITLTCSGTDEPEILSLATGGAPSEEEQQVAAADGGGGDEASGSTDMPPEGMGPGGPGGGPPGGGPGGGSGGGPPGGGPGGGPGGPPPLNLIDDNGDGQISEEELPAPIRQLFGSIDKNSDGTIDQAEYEAYRTEPFNRSGGPSGGDGQQGRPEPPERPSPQDEDSAEPAAEQETDDSKAEEAGADSKERDARESESPSPASAEAERPE